jgi:hypothetical protein
MVAILLVFVTFLVALGPLLFPDVIPRLPSVYFIGIFVGVVFGIALAVSLAMPARTVRGKLTRGFRAVYHGVPWSYLAFIFALFTFTTVGFSAALYGLASYGLQSGTIDHAVILFGIVGIFFAFLVVVGIAVALRAR